MRDKVEVRLLVWVATTLSMLPICSNLSYGSICIADAPITATSYSKQTGTELSGKRAGIVQGLGRREDGATDSARMRETCEATGAWGLWGLCGRWEEEWLRVP